MLRLIEDPTAVRYAVREWRLKLGADRGQDLALPEIGLWGRFGGANRRTRRYLNTFRVQKPVHPDAVQINIDPDGIQGNVRGAVGTDEDRRRWILRQGSLRPNRAQGGVTLTEFADYTTLPNAEVEPPPARDRQYYTVACIEDSPENVKAATAAFVKECDLVRYRVHGYGLVEDIEAVEDDLTTTETEREQLVKARLGQGIFRILVARRWENKCAVTGCTVNDVLRASHIKPWRHSTNAERLNPANGLFLAAHLDALFDRGFIAFNDQGEMLISNRISKPNRKLLGIPKPLRLPVRDQEKAFLSLHRSQCFT